MAAKNYLNGLMRGQRVGVLRLTTDRYDRNVAELYLNGWNVGAEMVKSGYAYIYQRYAYQ